MYFFVGVSDMMHPLFYPGNFLQYICAIIFFMVIDSHVYFWKYDKNSYNWIDSSMKALKQDYLPSDIQLTLHRNNIDACIAVQSIASQLETRFLAELANTNSFIKAVIGWTDLLSEDAEKHLNEWQEYPVIKGIRYNLQDKGEAIFDDTRFREGISLLGTFGYTFDLLILPGQLSAAASLASAFPGQQFVLNHCGSPDVRQPSVDRRWLDGIEELSSQQNVYCKVSGLLTQADWKQWSPAVFYPYLDKVFAAFGTGRLLFGSDWPVMLLSGIYVQWKSLLEKYMENYPDEEVSKVFGENARAVYGL